MLHPSYIYEWHVAQKHWNPTLHNTRLGDQTSSNRWILNLPPSEPVDLGEVPHKCFPRLPGWIGCQGYSTSYWHSYKPKQGLWEGHIGEGPTHSPICRRGECSIVWLTSCILPQPFVVPHRSTGQFILGSCHKVLHWFKHLQVVCLAAKWRFQCGRGIGIYKFDHTDKDTPMLQ